MLIQILKLKVKIFNLIKLIFYFFKDKRNINKQKFIYWVEDKIKRYYDIYFEENSILMYWGYNNLITKFIDNFNSFSKLKYNQTLDSNFNVKKDLIIASGDYLYLDCGSGNKYGGKTWCGDYKTWKDIYQIKLFKNYKNFNVLGAQISLFGELADEYSFIGKIFPRAISISEKLWNFDYSNNINDIKIKNLFVNIINMNKRLNYRGVTSISITTQLCENKPELCIDEIK